MKVKHVYLTSSEPSDLAAFYSKMGLPVRFADGERWVQFGSDGAAFCIAGIGESAVSPASNAVVVFEVESVEQALARAREAGADVSEPIRDMGNHGRVLRIRDIQGNTVQFFESHRDSAR